MTSSPPPGRKDPLRVARFERRVVTAIAVAALMPVIGALVFGRAVLREVYVLGVNPSVQRELQGSVDGYNAYFEALRADSEHTADAIAWEHDLVGAIRRDDRETARDRLELALERYPDVVRVRVESERGSVFAEAARAAGPSARTREIVRRIEPDAAEPGAPAYRVSIVASAPADADADFARAAEVVDLYGQLVANMEWITNSYLLAYIALLLSVVVVALAAGIVVSRRVTRRVAVLAEATERVGRGDLSVEVPTDEADEVGELTRAFNAMVRDIRTSRDRIEYLQRVGAWQEMARRLAHEIKNPLTPIQLAVQELSRTYKGDDPKLQRTLDDVRDIVEEEVTTLRRLVKEFSEFARLPEPAIEPADLRSFVREAAKALEPAALTTETGEPPPPGLPLPELRLEIEGDEELPVKIDTQMLRRCLDNLVRNAVQAIVGSRARSGPGGRVTVAARRDGDEAVLEVRDDGPGVPDALRDRVFDPYYTTREEGTGLGLAITKKVVLEHGGTIECAEAPEGGASFRIRLPLAPARGEGPRA